MSRIKELEKWPDHEEHIFPCDAYDGDYLRASWDGEDDEWRYLWVEPWIPRNGPFVRLKIIWKVLRGKPVGDGGGVLLTPETTRSLYDFLKSKVEP